jgi:SAM-dependent methyltransferase
MRRVQRWEVLRRVPIPLKVAAKRAMWLADPVVLAGYRLRTGERRPIPPFRLRARVGVPGHRITRFLESGAQVAADLEATLEELGRPLSNASRVLDFGCGNGRVLAHLAGRHPDGKPELYGSDVDGEAIAWATRAYPHVRFAVNGYAPPLAFPDEHFDLVYSISIFTHLDEASQDAWLRELDRVVAPGGMLLVTTNGEGFLQWYRKSPAAVESTHRMSERLGGRGLLADEGLIFEPYARHTINEEAFPGVDAQYGLTFHSEGYVRSHWGEIFEVDQHLPGAINSGQDLVVLRKRTGNGSASGPRSHADDDVSRVG